MILDNLRLLFSLYVRPARTMGRILDEGSLLFGAIAVLAVGTVLSLALVLPLWSVLETQLEGLPADEHTSPSGEPSHAPPPIDPMDGGLAGGNGQGGRGVASMIRRAFLGSMVGGIISALAALALLYVPGCVLAATLLAPVGSFGVAFRRDYGALLACALFSWTAAQLPFALLSLGVPGVFSLLRLLLVLLGLLAFAFFMVLAVRSVFGVATGVATGVTLLGSFALLLAPLGPFLASPFLLYIAWQYFRGDISDVSSFFGRRQSFKRHLHAATLNPRDAEAHYQLGLLHQQRRETEEAKARFEKAVEIDPREIDAHYQLGRLGRGEGRFEDAIRHFEDVVGRDETHSRHEIWREIGATYAASTSWPNARWALEKYVAQRPHDPEGLLLLGQVLSASGEKPLAEDALRRCIESVDTMPAFRRGEVARFKREAKKLLRALLAALLLALAPVATFAQVDPGFEPVPAANLASDATLKVPEENFSIRAPGPQWEWLRDGPARDAVDRRYLCRNLRTGERFLLTVSPPSAGSAQKYAEDWIARIKTTQEAQRRELVGPRSDPSDVPVTGSYRLSTMITGPGATIYFTGYVVGAGRIYALQHYSDAPSESSAFNAFARSFALLDPTAAPAMSLFGGLRTALMVVSALAVLLVAARAFGLVGKGKRAGPR